MNRVSGRFAAVLVTVASLALAACSSLPFMNSANAGSLGDLPCATGVYASHPDWDSKSCAGSGDYGLAAVTFSSMDDKTAVYWLNIIGVTDEQKALDQVSAILDDIDSGSSAGVVDALKKAGPDSTAPAVIGSWSVKLRRSDDSLVVAAVRGGASVTPTVSLPDRGLPLVSTETVVDLAGLQSTLTAADYRCTTSADQVYPDANRMVCRSGEHQGLSIVVTAAEIDGQQRLASFLVQWEGPEAASGLDAAVAALAGALDGPSGTALEDWKLNPAEGYRVELVGDVMTLVVNEDGAGNFRSFP